MEDKQLNFNRPLLSVRRGSSTSALAEIDKKRHTNPPSDIRRFPHYKPDLKSGPMSNPAAVPFKWEQIPGRAKDERKPQIKLLEQPAPAPKLPPGRMVNNEENPSRKLSKDCFGSMSQRGFDAASIADESSVSKNVGEIEENDSSLSEGEGSTYLDALDTLSRSESSFLNCSMSGVSGLDDHGVKSSGTSLDLQTRDFMMGRFLPAAKAVASETPHFGSRKQLVVREQQAVISNKQTPRFYYTPTSLPQYLEDEREEEDEDEDEDADGDEYERTENVSTKLCGLLPRFCMLNPIPGMKGQPPTSIPPVRKLPKKYANSCIYDKCEKAIIDAVYERRRLTIYQRSKMRVGANDFNDELEQHNLKSASLKSDELASSESNTIIPYRSVSQQSLMSKGTGFLGIPEAAKHPEATIFFGRSPEATIKLNSYRNGPTRFRESTADEEVIYASRSPTVEKTLYIDSTQIAEYQESNSRRIHPLQLSTKDDIETILPLPLPKRPSESWLSHALPSMSSRRPLSKLYLGDKSLTLKPTPTESKWEALVKSSSVHNNNLGLSGLMRISED